MSTVEKQLSIANLRLALHDRGAHHDAGMSKKELAAALIESDRTHWKTGMKRPLPKAGKKSTKDIAEDSLKALGVKGIK